MQAAIQTDDEFPCVVYWTGRKGLSVKIITWCGEHADASDGVIQIPDDADVCSSCKIYIESKRPNVK